MAASAASISPQVAARELLRRRRARTSLVAYSQAIEIPGAPVSEDPDEWLFKPIETTVAAHHILTMEAIERCIRTDYGRLMLLMPPGSAKSTYAAVVAPTWAMGAFPGLRVLMTSYAAAPILRASRRARQIVRSELFTSIWPERPAPLRGSEAVDEWELSNGSGILAAGILGGITSSRADLCIIDDPVSGREDADSETMRAKTKQAYQDDVLTRLKPRGSVVLIQTRWHEDDLAGGILPENYDGRSGPVLCRDGQTWEVLCLPAQAERADDPLGRKPGEFLWPEWFGPQHWAIFQSQARTWSALYQQRPVPDTGGQFKREDFQWYGPGALPAGLRYYGCSDRAVTKKQEQNDPDYSELYAVGVDAVGDLWFADGWFDRQPPDVVIERMLQMVKAHGIVAWFDEGGVIRHAVQPLMTRMMQDSGTWVHVEYLPTIGDKVARLASFRGRVSQRKVHMPAGVAWAVRLVDQLCAFPMARYDDGADACGNLGRGLDFIANAEPDKPKPKPAPEPFTDEWFELRHQHSSPEERHHL